MNLIQYIVQADPEEKIISRENNFIQNGINWYREYSKMSKLNDNRITDENKHQYMSCLAGRGGKAEAIAGWGIGLGKEAIDLTKKTLSPNARKRYNGVVNIFKDSQKDIKNNWKGLQYGLENKGKCINLLEQKLP